MTLLLLSTADTDLLAARSVTAPALDLRLANPSRVDDPVALLDGVRLVVVRLLGGRRAWDGLLPEGLVLRRLHEGGRRNSASRMTIWLRARPFIACVATSSSTSEPSIIVGG